MKKYNHSIALWSLLTFFYIYDIALTVLPSFLSSRKIILTMMLIYVIVKLKKISIIKVFLFFCLPLVILSIYVFVVLIINNTFFYETSILSRYFYFLLYSLIGTVLAINIFSDLSFFLNCVKYAGIYQSVIIFGIFFLNPVREFCTSYIVNEGNVSFLRITDRGTGIGAEGAYLTILLMLSAVSCYYFIIKKVKPITNIIILCFLTLAMFVVGRTGLYATIVLGIIMFLKEFFKHNKITYKKIFICLLSIIMIIASIFVIIRLSQTNERIVKLLRLFTGIFNFETGDRSINELGQMRIPPFSVNNILGYGIYRGNIGNISIQNDMGYVQTYFSIGVLGSIIFYGTIFIYLFTLLRNIKKRDSIMFHLMSLLFVTFFVIEIKEPFFIKNVIVSFYIVMCRLIGGYNDEYEM